MTDELELTEEEKLREEARESIKAPAEPIPDAKDLPDDVRDGHIEDEP